MQVYVICHLDGDDAPTCPKVHDVFMQKTDADQELAEIADCHNGHVDEDGNAIEHRDGCFACYKCLQYYTMYPVEVRS